MTAARVNQVLAVAALALAGAAALAGARPSATDRAVDAVTLATWIRARRAIAVRDLRDAAARAMFQLPTARPPDGPLAALVAAPGDTLVLVDDGSGGAADSAVALRDAPGTVLWLAGGVPAWSRDVLNPTIAEDAPDSAFARFGRVADLSRYFGGLPRMLPAGATDTLRGDLGRTVRRGCGFD